ncbi:hypothetical protein D0T51_06740 [Parabacteroides sp. 52]|uniref:hypothetical protein n=1 Tax=unclassified Parabacteroides TaxID=2649774 RepID=UPI0013D2D1D4|nr:MULTISPECIES: hypothetical protein [unclassified Parabacteroides]MDH6534191.1 hypothetical protein [Parabacteroides sp. PM5-20]NDV55425.1 hypothetical protein [Parabacteroides sp. 52]
MRRLASHYIWWRDVYRLHYLELDDANRLVGVYPLTEEMAGTVFVEGILLPVLAEETKVEEKMPHWKLLTEKVEIGSFIQVYHLQGLELTAAKLGTYDGGSHCHIQRL